MPRRTHAIAKASPVIAAAFLISACSGNEEVVEEVPVSPAEAACLEAVADTTGGANVSVLSSVPTKTGTNVQVAVEGAQAPWSCDVSSDGMTVINVEYTGSEGYL